MTPANNELYRVPDDHMRIVNVCTATLGRGPHDMWHTFLYGRIASRLTGATLTADDVWDIAEGAIQDYERDSKQGKHLTPTPGPNEAEIERLVDAILDASTAVSPADQHVRQPPSRVSVVVFCIMVIIMLALGGYLVWDVLVS